MGYRARRGYLWYSRRRGEALQTSKTAPDHGARTTRPLQPAKGEGHAQWLDVERFAGHYWRSGAYLVPFVTLTVEPTGTSAAT